MSKITGNRAVVEASAYSQCELPVEGGGCLVIDEGKVAWSFWFELLHESEDLEWDVLEGMTQIADSEGVVWEGRTICLPGDMIESAGSMRHSASSVFFDDEDADEKRRAAFDKAPLVIGARTELDGRSLSYLTIGGITYMIYFKHQAPTIDLAFLGGLLPKLLGRVNGLQCTSPDDETEISELPPFLIELELNRELFIHRYQNLTDFDGAQDPDLFPKAVTLRRTEIRSTPQPSVRYCAAGQSGP